jgi:alpha-D-ribose 1-methylphosphonate 5-triphosphate synthase subunit PhnG
MKDPLQPQKNPIARREDEQLRDYQRPSSELIYDAIMKAGGEFEPFEIGTGTLTERVVKLFSQFGFFGFEWLEKRLRPRNQRNKFTRYGSAQFRGDYPQELIEKINELLRRRRQSKGEE